MENCKYDWAELEMVELGEALGTKNKGLQISKVMGNYTSKQVKTMEVFESRFEYFKIDRHVNH